MAEVKFKLTAETKVNIFGIKLFRIEATASFKDVKKGDKGGWVSSKDVNGNARVSGDAWVYGNAQVSGDARVYGNAEVYGNAWVSGDAWVSGNAQVYGNARVSGDAQVSGDAWVYGDARVSGDALDSGYCFAYKGNAWDVTEVPTADGEGVLLVKDYTPPETPEATPTINIGGTEYEVTDELTKALKNLKEA